MDELFLVRPQIQDACKLSLPEGMKDLMADISREVLRTQPPDLYHFIADYLSAMLVSRDALSIACRICQDVCKCSCQPELESELRNIGLDGDDLETTKNIVMEYFDKGGVKEGNLLMVLLNKTGIDEYMLPAIRDAIRTAFMTHQLYHLRGIMETAKRERGPEAANNTLMVYEKLNDDQDVKDWAATRIQIRAASTKQQQIIESLENLKKQHDHSSSSSSKYVPCSANSSVKTFSEYEEQERCKNKHLSSKGKEKKTILREHTVSSEGSLIEDVEDESVKEVIEELQNDENACDDENLETNFNGDADNKILCDDDRLSVDDNELLVYDLEKT